MKIFLLLWEEWVGKEQEKQQGTKMRVIKLLFHFIIIISYYFSQIDDKNSTKMVMIWKIVHKLEVYQIYLLFYWLSVNFFYA